MLGRTLTFRVIAVLMKNLAVISQPLNNPLLRPALVADLILPDHVLGIAATGPRRVSFERAVGVVLGTDAADAMYSDSTGYSSSSSGSCYSYGPRLLYPLRNSRTAYKDPMDNRHDRTSRVDWNQVGLDSVTSFAPTVLALL